MKIYVDDFYNNKYNIKYNININYVISIVNELNIKNNINYIPIKALYSIIYLVKHNVDFKLIDKIVYNKVLKKNYMKISKLIPNIIEYKWIKFITISIYNNVENELIDYFLELYKLYIDKEQNKRIFIMQAKSIMKKKVLYFRQLKKIFVDDIYYTVYYIPIIFSKIDKKFISENNIFIY
tara:strand:+ start:705 stop:1244 length:540 start_codon:yes stop_codon:yes gene_type:complete